MAVPVGHAGNRRWRRGVAKGAAELRHLEIKPAVFQATIRSNQSILAPLTRKIRACRPPQSRLSTSHVVAGVVVAPAVVRMFVHLSQGRSSHPPHDSRLASPQPPACRKAARIADC
jgi:hypothetical protein